jgi:hypothetical protein
MHTHTHAQGGTSDVRCHSPARQQCGRHHTCTDRRVLRRTRGARSYASACVFVPTFVYVAVILYMRYVVWVGGYVCATFLCVSVCVFVCVCVCVCWRASCTACTSQSCLPELQYLPSPHICRDLNICLHLNICPHLTFAVTSMFALSSIFACISKFARTSHLP